MSRLTTLVVVLAVTAVGACNCNGSGSESGDRDAEARANAAQEGGGSSADVPAENYYSVESFSQLRGDNRAKFVDVAKSELCPCPDVDVSLDQCLDDAEIRCASAERAAQLLGEGLKGGLSKTDVRSQLAEYSEESSKTYSFTLEGVPRKGPKDAPVRIVEFANFECPHCKRAANLMKDLKSKHGDDVAHYFKHYPPPGKKSSEIAHRASFAAHKQGKFWPMHDLLFKHQRSLSKKKIERFARRLGLNFSKFKSDMNSAAAKKAIQRDRQEGTDAEIRGTPEFFINGRRYMGQKTEAEVSKAIQSALDRASDEGDGSGEDTGTEDGG